MAVVVVPVRMLVRPARRATAMVAFVIRVSVVHGISDAVSM
jgi:hypothetical protein